MSIPHTPAAPGISQLSTPPTLNLLLLPFFLAQVTLPQPGAPSGTPPLPEVRPIAPPVSVFPYPVWMVVCAALAAALILGLLTWWAIRYFRSHAAPPPTPRQRALAALGQLRGRIASVEPYPFSIEVSDVLRTFVTREFQVRATEQTSPEFLAAASASSRFTEEDKALLATFLEKADLIKFARVHASASDSEQLLDQAFRFVEGGVPAA